jgi:hypothetical protein
MQKLLALASLLALGSCSSNSGSSPAPVSNSNPLGTVGGVVWDAASEMPLAGATVSVISGGKLFTAMTDMNGLFGVASVPSGNFIASVSAMSYLTASINGALGGAVGSTPVSNPITTLGPIGLIKSDGTFSVLVVDQFGAPTPNIPLTARPQVRWVNFNNGTPTPLGSFEVTATTGMDGIVTFMGLPDYVSIGSLAGGVDGLPIDVPPMQVMGSMTVYSFLGSTFTFQVTHLGNNNGGVVDMPMIRLAGPLTPLTVLNSNLDYLRSVTAGSSLPSFAGISTIPFIAPTGPITIEFNQSINRGTIRATLVNEDGSQATVGMMATGSNNLLTLTPMSALTAGTRYNLILHVDASNVPGQQSVNRELDTTLPIFVAPASGVPVKLAAPSTVKTTLSTDGLQTLQVDFQFSEPVGVGFGRQDPISCVAYYEGINLNNGVMTPVPPGQWPMGSTTGIGATCPNSGLDITAITPLESQATGMPLTGFSSRWRATLDRIGHPECIQQASCNFPSPPPLMHLIFSHTTAPNTIKRPDGTPVPDSVPNFSFTPPGP